VSRNDTAEVIQGRLGWESGDISEANPANLKPHPKNAEIYGDTDEVDDLDATFKESVAEKGVLEPLVITNGKEIISGHRRWLAAKDAGLDSVPVRYSEFESDLAEREALIEFNRQRDKTPGQIVNEFEEMLEIETQRQGQGERNDLKDTSGNISGSYESESRERAAEKVNADVSGRTLEKGKTVKDKAESEDEPEEVREAARKAWDGLQSGDESFNSAYQEVRQTEREVQEQQQREQQQTEREQSFASAETVVETFHGDFRDILDDYAGEIDHIITDPPYDENAVELWDALGAVAADILPDGGFVVAYSGKAHLPAIHDVLSDHLNYYWQGIVRHSGPGAKIFSRKLRTGYKPVLIYQQGDLAAQEEFVSDVIEGSGREKDAHDWQQAEGEAAELVERFTAVDECVCDPMCGSGTVGVACRRLKRRVVLIDRDAEAIETTREKVADDE
jgi:ParB-like chromosome segregation protein Spo0J